MVQWVYKATQARASYADAHDLAILDHFLCKSIFARGPVSEGPREIELLGDVAVGDVIHYYYRTPQAHIRCFGSFRVVPASAFPELFEACPGRDAAVKVLATPQNQLMLGRLRRGYSPDPKLAGFTGWIVEKLAMSAGTPGFNQAEMFPSRTTTFWRYPDPSLPRARGGSAETQ